MKKDSLLIPKVLDFLFISIANMEPAFEYEDENPVYKKYDESQLIGNYSEHMRI
jgi:hypothetical protein